MLRPQHAQIKQRHIDGSAMIVPVDVHRMKMFTVHAHIILGRIGMLVQTRHLHRDNGATG